MSDQGAKEQVKETASQAAGQAQQVTGTAVDGAKQVAGTATEQAAQVAREASTHARELLSQTTTQLKDQAGGQAQRAAGGLRGVASQLEALTSGRPEEAGAAGDYARQATAKLSELASRIDDGGIDGVVDDVARYARRRPGLFLLGCAAAGFAMGRLVRGAQVASQSDSGSDQLYGSSFGAPALGTAYGTGYGTAAPVGTGYGTPAPLPPVQPVDTLAGTPVDVRSDEGF